MRSHYCGEVTKALLNESVKLTGWVHRRRDHGGVIFIDLRDREGLVQVVFHPDNKDIFKLAEALRNEYVLQITGNVNPRPDGTINAKMRTGEVEVNVTDIKILNTAETTPFPIDEYHEVNEETRLR